MCRAILLRASNTSFCIFQQITFRTSFNAPHTDTVMGVKADKKGTMLSLDDGRTWAVSSIEKLCSLPDTTPSGAIMTFARAQCPAGWVEMIGHQNVRDPHHDLIMCKKN